MTGVQMRLKRLLRMTGDGAATAYRPASGADVYNGQVHDEVADTIGANSGDGTTAGGKVIV